MDKKTEEQLTFNFENPNSIKGFPQLHWRGKRSFNNTQYFPAQLKESYGNTDDFDHTNKLFWGDNLQVMSHLLKDYRGKIKMIYIDPPYDSKADYKKKIKIKSKNVTNDTSSFEEKQYTDIWSNDEYLQYMYERIILMRELLSNDGCIVVHSDYRKTHHLRCILDEVFGSSTDSTFRNEIVWAYRTGGAPKDFSLARKHDTLLIYSKSSNFKINPFKERQYLEKSFMGSQKDSQGRFYVDTVLRDTFEGVLNIVKDQKNEVIEKYNTRAVLNLSSERVDYPTQKPEGLIKLLIEICSNDGDIIFDSFMGSGTTQAVAMKLNRNFIGADINLGSIQITTKRLLSIMEKNNLFEKKIGFEVYNVNNYDFFRNPLEAKQLLLESLEIEPLSSGQIYDGEKDGRMIKIMPTNRITTKADLKEIIENLPYKIFDKRQIDNPNLPVEYLTLICMGHEPDLKPAFERDLGSYKVDIQVVDILRDKSDLQFKRESEIKIERNNDKLIIEAFYPMNLLQKLSIERENVNDWRELVESVMIDFNYDGEVLKPDYIEVPEKDKLVKGIYLIPKESSKIKVKVTDLLSETIEREV